MLNDNKEFMSDEELERKFRELLEAVRKISPDSLTFFTRETEKFEHQIGDKLTPLGRFIAMMFFIAGQRCEIQFITETMKGQ